MESANTIFRFGKIILFKKKFFLYNLFIIIVIFIYNLFTHTSRVYGALKRASVSRFEFYRQ